MWRNTMLLRRFQYVQIALSADQCALPGALCSVYIILIIAGRRIPRARRVLLCMQQLHILRRQLKIIDVGILLNPGRCFGFGQRHESLQHA